MRTSPSLYIALHTFYLTNRSAPNPISLSITRCSVYCTKQYTGLQELFQLTLDIIVEKGEIAEVEQFLL